MRSFCWSGNIPTPNSREVRANQSFSRSLLHFHYNLANSCPPVFQDFCKELENPDLGNLRCFPLASRISRLLELFIFCKNWNFSLPWNFSDLIFLWVPLCYTDTNICNLNATILNANRYVNVYPPNSMGNDGIIVKPILARNFRHQRCRITRNEQNRANTLRERCDWKSCPNLHRSQIWARNDLFEIFAWDLASRSQMIESNNLCPAPSVETLQPTHKSSKSTVKWSI